MKERYWVGEVPKTDDFGNPIKDIFIDGRVNGHGSWALMTPHAHNLYGMGLGTGKGQRYEKRVDGKWEKTGG